MTSVGTTSASPALLTCIGHRAFQQLAAAADEDDGVAFVEQSRGDGFTDSGTRSGYDRDFAW